MKSFAAMLCAALVLGNFALSPAYAQKGEVVKPNGNGPVPKGKSGVVDNVLGENGWGNCIAPFEQDYWCSSNSTFFSPGKQPKKTTK
jgi:hypothetical protein